MSRGVLPLPLAPQGTVGQMSEKSFPTWPFPVPEPRIARRCSQIMGGPSAPQKYCCITTRRPPSFPSLLCRCSQIMGRNESDDLSAAQIFYPCMQCADIFFLKADICQLGMDQRKVGAGCGCMC